LWVVDPDEDGTVATRFREMLGEAALQKFKPIQEPFSRAFGYLQQFAAEL